MLQAGAAAGLTVWPGMEVETREEVHLICLFDTLEQDLAWQEVVYAACRTWKTRRTSSAASSWWMPRASSCARTNGCCSPLRDLSVEEIVGRGACVGWAVHSGPCGPAVVQPDRQPGVRAAGPEAATRWRCRGSRLRMRRGSAFRRSPAIRWSSMETRTGCRRWSTRTMIKVESLDDRRAVSWPCGVEDGRRVICVIELVQYGACPR